MVRIRLSTKLKVERLDLCHNVHLLRFGTDKLLTSVDLIPSLVPIVGNEHRQGVEPVSTHFLFS